MSAQTESAYLLKACVVARRSPCTSASSGKLRKWEQRLSSNVKQQQSAVLRIGKDNACKRKRVY